MIYIIIAVFVFILFLITFNFLRKLQWDAVHHNLIDLADDIGGEVIRRSMLSRPIYHGNFKKQDITINFSTEKVKKGRNNFIDISIGHKFSTAFTISAFAWLEEREDSALDEFASLNIKSTQRYGLRSDKGEGVINKKKESQFHDFLIKLDPFYFIYIGNNGLLFEKDGGNLAISTKHPALKNDIDALIGLIKVIN